MFAPGIVAAGVALLVLLFMKESPESQGYAPVNAPKEPAKDEKREPLLATPCAACMHPA